MTCQCCGEKGHCMSDCQMKDKMSQENWAIKTAMQMVQNPNNKAMAEANEPNNDNKSGGTSAEQ